MDAQKYVWKGAIPLQLQLHESDVTALPPPPPLLILAPRIGYLPLMTPLIKPHFSSALPPGADTIWFEYKGLPLKWYIPTGVLFDLLCPEPERPWNLTVHFRGYPGNILIPCEGEDSVKWSFINSLKELTELLAAYIINGNCKNVMNMSQSDQFDLWRSVLNGDLDTYQKVSAKLKLGIVDDEFVVGTSTALQKSQESIAETDNTGQGSTVKIPVRLYIWSVTEDLDDLDNVPQLDSWDKITYINRPVEVRREGKYFTLLDAVKSLLPSIFADQISEEISRPDVEGENPVTVSKEDTDIGSEDKTGGACVGREHLGLSHVAEIKLLRIQGIEPKLEIPFSWVANNLIFPEQFLHICIYVKLAPENIL